ncbi:MAG TPA: hypothetical protein VNV82_13830 [Bryobacteraceae bacterium]|nr:hypothetical protein [Bryobacteraceae bacterium]
MSQFFFSATLASLALGIPSMAASVPSVVPMIQTGYHQMYNLEFDGAHKTFAQFEQQRPDDPLGHVSNAAAYLFAEFDRLNILQSEFFVNDDRFRHAKRLTPDAAVRQAFDGELAKAEQLANGTLARSPQDPDALFANILSMGLRADYSALVEKRYLDSLRVIKNGRETAEKLLAIAPDYYDAYLAIGVENYMLSLKAAPVRWLLSLGGAQVDRERGIQDLRLTAEKGHYLSPYARLLLAVAAMRNKDRAQARDLLTALVHDFPHNKLYSEELARLQ